MATNRKTSASGVIHIHQIPTQIYIFKFNVTLSLAQIAAVFLIHLIGIRVENGHVRKAWDGTRLSVGEHRRRQIFRTIKAERYHDESH
ncbi:hypothetical protein H4Q26_009599 [Puccinia striiformis f. sp. tritici PST-130]|nr:hypothetical protein H4Q26_009599 [Puccinia striiformis f. sp. tritici PST-130]